MLKRGSRKAQSTKIGLKDPLPKQQLHSAAIMMFNNR
jgi:hypothetical protein